MNEVKPWKAASVHSNGDFYLIETYSGYRLSGRDPAGKQHTLKPNATDRELGSALLDALTHSRFMSLDEARNFFDYKAVQQRHETWKAGLMAQHGYKTKQALFRNMALCNISLTLGDEFMVMRPQHHERLEAWGRSKNDGIEDLCLPADSAPEVVGQALLMALTRCT